MARKPAKQAPVKVAQIFALNATTMLGLKMSTTTAITPKKLTLTALSALPETRGMEYKQTRTIDLGWEKVVLERVSSGAWFTEYADQKIRIERVDRGSGHRWDAYFYTTPDSRSSTGALIGRPTLRDAVERVLTEALVLSGESRRSITSRKGAATKKARRDGEIIRKGRKKAPWNF